MADKSKKKFSRKLAHKKASPTKKASPAKSPSSGQAKVIRAHEIKGIFWKDKVRHYDFMDVVDHVYSMPTKTGGHRYYVSGHKKGNKPNTMAKIVGEGAAKSIASELGMKVTSKQAKEGSPRKSKTVRVKKGKAFLSEGQAARFAGRRGYSCRKACDSMEDSLLHEFFTEGSFSEGGERRLKKAYQKEGYVSPSKRSASPSKRKALTPRAKAARAAKAKATRESKLTPRTLAARRAKAEKRHSAAKKVAKAKKSKK